MGCSIKCVGLKLARTKNTPISQQQQGAFSMDIEDIDSETSEKYKKHFWTILTSCLALGFQDYV